MNSISIKINRTNKKCIQLIALLFIFLFVSNPSETLCEQLKMYLPKTNKGEQLPALPDETSVSR